MLHGVILPLLLSLSDFTGDVRPILERQIGLSQWLAARRQGRVSSSGGDTPVVAAAEPVSA